MCNAPHGRQRRAAGRAVRRVCFVAVLLDMKPTGPDIDGLTILKQIRAKAPKLPVVNLFGPDRRERDRIVGLEWAPMTTCPRPSIRVKCWPACARGDPPQFLRGGAARSGRGLLPATRSFRPCPFWFWTRPACRPCWTTSPWI
jgi:hypothetical protein